MKVPHSYFKILGSVVDPDPAASDITCRIGISDSNPGLAPNFEGVDCRGPQMRE